MATSISIEDLIPDPDNPRRRTERGESTLETSMDKFGAARSIVIDKDGVVRAGNGTLQAAAKAGIKSVRIIEGKKDELIAVRRADWSEEQAEKYSIMDNRSAELAEWDYPVLDSKLEKYSAAAPEDFGFMQNEVDSIRANAKWLGTGLENDDAVTGKQSNAPFNPEQIQVTVLDYKLASEVLDVLRTALADYSEHVVVEKL